MHSSDTRRFIIETAHNLGYVPGGTTRSGRIRLRHVNGALVIVTSSRSARGALNAVSSLKRLARAGGMA
jgi:hypothetical protein